MTKSDSLISTLILAAAIVLGAAVHAVIAQSGGSPIILGTQTALSGCTWPTAYATVTNGLAMCPLSLSSGPALAIAVNGGTFVQIPMSGGTTYTGTSPIVVSGGVISCPTCITGSGTVGQVADFTAATVLGSEVLSYSQLSGLPTTTGACTGGSATGTGTITAGSAGSISLSFTSFNAGTCPF